MRIQKIKDFALNILASGLMTAGLQLVVYPLLARTYTAGDYGRILTIMGLCNTISATFGNSLNNARLVNASKYMEKHLYGDYPLLLNVSCALSAISGFAVSALIGGDWMISLLLALTNLLATIRLYYSVSFRLKLDFISILKCNGLTAVGYIIGAIAVLRIQYWPIAFLVGEILGGLYAAKKSGLIFEIRKKTILFSETCKVYFYLIVSTLVGNIAVYMDRLFLYPIIGDQAVSVYTTASIIGKCIGIVMLPISGVLLSYYAQKDSSMTKQTFYRQSVWMVFLAMACILLLKPISPIFTKLLYPTLYDDASQYIFIANAAAIIGVLGNMLTPAILKFAETYWQIVVAIVYCVGYFALGYIFAAANGLAGFCVAALLANIIKCLILLLLGLRINNRNGECNEAN